MERRGRPKGSTYTERITLTITPEQKETYDNLNVPNKTEYLRDLIFNGNNNSNLNSNNNGNNNYKELLISLHAFMMANMTPSGELKEDDIKLIKEVEEKIK